MKTRARDDMSPAEYAAHSGLSLQGVYAGIRRGSIVADKIGRKWVIDGEASDKRRGGAVADGPVWVTVTQYARMRGVPRQTVVDAIAIGAVPVREIAGKREVDVRSADLRWADRIIAERGNDVVALYESQAGDLELDEFPIESATEIANRLRPGLRLCGLTKGQVSQIDLLLACLAYTGPADVYVASFAVRLKDAHTMRKLRKDKRIKRLQFVLDRGSASTRREWTDRLIELFGPTAVRHTINHAKIVVVDGEDRCCAIRSSMNLNRNLRHEQFDIDCERGAVEFYKRWFEDFEHCAPCGSTVTTQEAVKSIEESMGGRTPVKGTYTEVIDPRETSPGGVGVKARAMVNDPRGGDANAAEDDDVDYYTERAMLERAKRIKAEIAVEQLRGGLVDRAEAARAWASVGASVRQRVLGIPSRIAAQMASIDNQHDVRELLDRELREALTVLVEDVLLGGDDE